MPQARYACIDDLISDRLRALGVFCPCSKHVPERFTKCNVAPTKTPLRDFKSAAANDDTEKPCHLHPLSRT